MCNHCILCANIVQVTRGSCWDSVVTQTEEGPTDHWVSWHYCMKPHQFKHKAASVFNYFGFLLSDQAILWNIRHCSYLRKLRGHKGVIFAVDLDEGAKVAFTASGDKVCQSSFPAAGGGAWECCVTWCMLVYSRPYVCGRPAKGGVSKSCNHIPPCQSLLSITQRCIYA